MSPDPQFSNDDVVVTHCDLIVSDFDRLSAIHTTNL